MAVQEKHEKKLYTADDLWLLSLQGLRYELIEGELVEISPGNETHGELAAEILRLIGNYVREHKLGRVYAAETGFKLSETTIIAPDAAYVSQERVKPRTEKFASVIPDLAVEVYSPGDTQRELHEKIALYFNAGTRQVWVIFPKSRAVYVYHSETAVTILKDESIIEGGAVLPGFQIKVNDLFSVLNEA